MGYEHVVVIFSFYVLCIAWIPRIALASISHRKPSSPMNCLSCQNLLVEIGEMGGCCRRRLLGIQVGIQVLLLVASLLVFFQTHSSDPMRWLLSLPLLYFLALCALTDYWVGLIPNPLTYTAVLVFLGLRTIYHTESLVYDLLVALVLYGILFLLSWWTQGLGGGDVKLLLAVSLLMPWPQLLFAIWLASVSAMIWLVFRWLREAKWRRAFPFGPHLALGCCIAYGVGDLFLTWYLGLFR